MIQSCIILLLVAAFSVYANGTPTCSHKETTTPTCSHKETTTPTCCHKETATSSCSQNGTAISYLETAMDMFCKAKYKIPACDDSSKVPTKKPMDCADVLEMGHNNSGVYVIWPVNRMMEGKPLKVYCDMETNGGGWIVIQRRGDFGSPRDYFFQDWKSYKEGFGELEKDFWLGNDNIFSLTNQKLYSIRFDLKDFDYNKKYALYDNFWIGYEDHKYTLQISGYSGDAGNSMEYHNNMSFITKYEKDYTGRYCIQRHKSAWWHRNCANVNLNGLYYKGKSETPDGIFWDSWKQTESLAWTEMKIRPKHFRLPVS